MAICGRAVAELTVVIGPPAVYLASCRQSAGAPGVGISTTTVCIDRCPGWLGVWFSNEFSRVRTRLQCLCESSIFEPDPCVVADRQRVITPPDRIDLEDTN